MGAIKRKADASSAPAKKDKGASGDRSAKRPRKSDGAADTPAKEKPEKTERAAPKASVFKDEEASFPRGGASVLTPLEHKQIQIKANQDVLFEQTGAKRTGGGADEYGDMGSEDEGKAAKAAKKRPAKKGKKSHGDEEKEDVVKAEGLNYKKLALGTLILGQVTDITHQDVVLSLPNNLVGYVPITAVSDKLNERLENLLKEEEEGEKGEDEEEFEDVELRDMFFVGQYLRACVTSTTDDTARARKRLELSIDPKLVNKGVPKRKIPTNLMIQASVSSNEDHGLVMDLGLEDSKIKGFLPKGELGAKVQHSKVQEGAVFMCLVTGLNSDGKIVKLSADQTKSGNLSKGNTLTDAPTIDVFLPGTAVDVLVADTTASTLTGKILGLIDATADAYHSGATEKGADISEKHKLGSKVKARILFTCPDAEPSKVGISLVDHVVSLSSRMSGKPKERKTPLEYMPVSTIVEEAKVIKVAPALGAFFELGVRDVIGFAHVSRLSDDRVDVLSGDAGAFKLDSKHRARVIGYNAIDGLFQLSLEQKVLDQAFLRIEDIKAGQVVKGKVHKLIADKKGAAAVLVHLSEGITGLVSELHLADVKLQHPERKFREGVPVTARVLYTDPARHQIQLTLKKSLVNSDVEPWTDYSKVKAGATGPGILVDVRRHGATVRFYGDVKAWLPVAEMSEAYIEDAGRHFNKGQVVNVRVLSVDPEERQLLVSCKDPAAVDTNKEAAFNALNPGDITKGTVVDKTDELATLDMGNGVKGLLRIGHLTDGSEKKDISTMKKIRVGGVLEDLVILNKQYKSKNVTVSNKPSLRKAAQSGKLVTSFADIKAGATVYGFVRGILPDKVFVELGNNISGAAFKSQLTDDMLRSPNFGLRKDQTVSAKVTHVDEAKELFWLSMKADADVDMDSASKVDEPTGEALVDPVDPTITSTTDINFGVTANVRIRSIKNTQLNVALGENVQGRISVAEIFDSWDDIKDKKNPLAQFKMNDTIKAKVLGRHDARNHRFLPITHRSSNKTPTYELTLKKEKLSNEGDVLSLEKISPDATLVAFVNNIADRFVWVNISANVRGRIDFLDLTDDLEKLSDIENNFPVGSALKVRVKSVDVAAGRLDLTAASSVTGNKLALKDLKVGYVLPARVTKTHDTSIVVKISEDIAAPIYLEQLADDYDKAKPSEFKTGDVLRVCIVDIDIPNKKLGLSARPSKVLSSSLPVKDPEIKDRSDLKVNQVVRGFIKQITDNGIYVRLGPKVEAYVRISELSDAYIKDWKAAFQVDQLVTGKVVSNKDNMRNPQLSLKASVIQGEYTEPIGWTDIEIGQIVTAKVRHVEDYGVFLLVDKSNNISGLCHISQLADTQVDKEKVKDMYKKDDVVKAKVLNVDPKKRKIGFTLKYSEIKGESDDDEAMEDASDVEADDDSEMEDGGIELDDDVDMRSVKSADSDEEDDAAQDDSEDESDAEPAKASGPGLSAAGFDWTGANLDFDEKKAASDDESDDEPSKKKKKSKKATIKEDRTGDLDAFGPQSVADYERLLLGQPNSSELWVRYMVFQRELNEIEKARQIARRALSTINPREDQEKLNVWTALLHLENDSASDEVVESTFKEACQQQDDREMHERMIKIYISSSKLDKADTLYQSMTKKKSFTVDPEFWHGYAAFLMDTLSPPSPPRARALLQRATQSVPSAQHRYLTQKFAALEFKSENGDAERGRTIFEGLVSTYPKKGDVWDVYIDLERSHGSDEQVRALYERAAKAGGKSKRIATVYKKWAEWESSNGNAKGVERVKALAEQWREEKAGKDDE